MIMNTPRPTMPAQPCPVDLMICESADHPTIRMPAALSEGLLFSEKLLAGLKGKK